MSRKKPKGKRSLQRVWINGAKDGERFHLVYRPVPPNPEDEENQRRHDAHWEGGQTPEEAKATESGQVDPQLLEYIGLVNKILGREPEEAPMPTTSARNATAHINPADLTDQDERILHDAVLLALSKIPEDWPTLGEAIRLPWMRKAAKAIQEPPNRSQNANHPEGDALVSAQVAILKVLLANDGTTMSIGAIEAKTCLSEKTILKWMKPLRDQEPALVMHQSPRTGFCLTDEGRNRAKVLPTDAGSEHIKPVTPRR